MTGRNEPWIERGVLTAERYAAMVEWLIERGRLGEAMLDQPDPRQVPAALLEGFVELFQARAEIATDGIFGPDTARALTRVTDSASPDRPTILPRDARAALSRLGYHAGDDDLMSDELRSCIRTFQADHRLPRTGVYDTATERRLSDLHDRLERFGPPGAVQLRRWQLTYYYVADEADYPGDKTIPLRDRRGGVIAMVTPRMFAAAALEGSARLSDGRLINVAVNPSYIEADPEVFAPVFAFARKNGWIPSRAGYAGLRTDGERATHARAFHVDNRLGEGWGVRRGIPLQPMRTLAADIGIERIRRHDRRFVGKGGVVPPKTRVFLLEFAGRRMPDGSVHDGWFTVNDTGGGIYGAHFDVFTGTRQRGRAARIRPRAHCWFEGIEQRIEADYTYGL